MPPCWLNLQSANDRIDFSFAFLYLCVISCKFSCSIDVELVLQAMQKWAGNTSKQSRTLEASFPASCQNFETIICLRPWKDCGARGWWNVWYLSQEVYMSCLTCKLQRCKLLQVWKLLESFSAPNKTLVFHWKYFQGWRIGLVPNQIAPWWRST